MTDLLTPASAEVDPMAADMQRVDEVIRVRLASEVALINQISHYIVSAGGKATRPPPVPLFPPHPVSLPHLRPPTTVPK